MSCPQENSDSVFVRRSETKDILADLSNLIGGAKKKRASKKALKKGSKKSSKKSSKKQKGGDLVLDGGAKRKGSKKGSKKSTKKSSKKGSKKQAGGREMNSKMKAALEISRFLKTELELKGGPASMKLSFKLLTDNGDSASKATAYVKSNKSSVKKMYEDMQKEIEKNRAAKKKLTARAKKSSKKSSKKVSRQYDDDDL
jgi:hypothetical protein